MDEHRKNLGLKLLQNAAEAMRRNGFAVSVFPDGAAAARAALELAGKGKKVGLGGCMTVTGLGLDRALAEAGNEVITHGPGMTPEERRAVWLAALSSDVYFASPQAVTADGKLIFVDGNGNRCAALTWGPRRLVLIAGVNKLVPDQESGLWRSRNVAAVANNLRLSKQNPCVRTGKCEDCASPQRICNVVTMLWKKPAIADITVLLANEDLGY
jgi:hypothetical protein